MRTKCETIQKENKVKNKIYFPLEANISNNVHVSELINTLGPKGFGIYIMILTELRQSADYRYNFNAVKTLAKKCGITFKMLNQVISGFNLFQLSEAEGMTLISSPYLDRVMRAYEKKVEKREEAGLKGYDKVGRDASGKFTADGGGIEKNRIDKNKTTTAVVVNNEPLQLWEKHLYEAMKDEAWVEILAMNSGISQLFMKHRAFAAEAFRQHVILQGRGSEIFSAGDLKAYFANFLRQGTPTQKRIAAQLAEREEEIRRTSTNPYETIDPQTGQRTYFGNPIPPDAPPRPNENAVWSSEPGQWI